MEFITKKCHGYCVHYLLLSLWTYPIYFFPFSIMYKLHGLASIKEGAIRLDHDGCLGPDSSHFLRLGPSLTEVHVGYWRTT
jgi:hypothetical protein